MRDLLLKLLEIDQYRSSIDGVDSDFRYCRRLGGERVEDGNGI